MSILNLKLEIVLAIPDSTDNSPVQLLSGLLIFIFFIFISELVLLFL